MNGTNLPRTRLGRTEWDVPRLGIGTYHLTSDRGVERHEAVAILRRAAALGIAVYDTAPRYGLGEAEGIVAEALGDRNGSYVLVNKVGRFERSIVERIGDAAYRDVRMIRAQFEHSMAVLRRDFLELLLVHEADWDQWWDGDCSGPVLEALEGLVREGRVGRIGLSMRDPARTQELCGTGAFDAMLYVHYRNLVWQEPADAALSTARQHDMGIMVGAPFRQGLLTDATAERLDELRAKPSPGVTPGVIERIARAKQIADEAGMSLLECGVRYLLSDPLVDVVVVGPRTVEELAQNVEWATRGRLPDDVLSALATLREIDPGPWIVKK